MAAPFSYVQGTIKDSQGIALAGAKISFRPLDTPKASGGDIVTSSYPSVTLDGAGKFGFSPQFPLVAGSYLVVITDRDTFAISVPGDGLVHAIETLSVDIGDIETYLHRTDLDINALSLALKDSATITHSRKGSINATRTRFCVVGEMDNATALDDLAPLIERNVPWEIIALNMNPPAGSAGTIDNNIGKFFHNWIKGYTGAWGGGPTVNHFWYSLGAADWTPGNVTAVTNFLQLPNNERYYNIVIGDVNLFVLDSNVAEPSGNAANSVQASWLTTAVASSVSRWNIVVFRDAPMASKAGYSYPAMNWPFGSMNIHAIICGGPRFYERLNYGTIPMFICGATSNVLDSFTTPVAGSQVRYNTLKGALFFDANYHSLRFWFNDRYGNIIDYYIISGSDTSQISSTVIPDSGIRTSGEGVGVNWGIATDQVLPGGMANFVRNMSGRVLPLNILPPPAEVYANPWLKECMILFGEDPVELWYWHKTKMMWAIFSPSAQGSTPYFTPPMTKLAAVTFNPLGGTQTVSVVRLTHAIPGVTIYYALDDGPYTTLSPTDDRVFIGAKARKVVVSAYATLANYKDADIFWQEYNTL